MRSACPSRVTTAFPSLQTNWPRKKPGKKRKLSRARSPPTLPPPPPPGVVASTAAPPPPGLGAAAAVGIPPIQQSSARDGELQLPQLTSDTSLTTRTGNGANVNGMSMSNVSVHGMDSIQRMVDDMQTGLPSMTSYTGSVPQDPPSPSMRPPAPLPPVVGKQLSPVRRPQMTHLPRQQKQSAPHPRAEQPQVGSFNVYHEQKEHYMGTFSGPRVTSSNMGAASQHSQSASPANSFHSIGSGHSQSPRSGHTSPSRHGGIRASNNSARKHVAGSCRIPTPR